MTTTIWLRAETKPLEARSAIAPAHAKTMIEGGFKVTVEKSSQRAITDKAYLEAGCEMVEPGSWVHAPEDAFILGVKDLPTDINLLRHRHIYFGHAYKEQEGWQSLLRRFMAGNGELFDIEFLVDANGRRIAAFGYWAGYTGCAVGLKSWIGQQLGRNPVVPPLSPYRSREDLLDDLRQDLDAAIEAAGHPPSVIIVGANGRVGTGAADLAHSMDLNITRWDIEETARGGPFDEILRHDLFVNCVLVDHKIAPFVTMATLSDVNRRLSVISDVSCDPGDNNPIPVYTTPTTFTDPTLRVIASPPLDLTAIDHLPSMLPVEASTDFGAQLLPYLLELGPEPKGVWRCALDVFENKTRNL
ncbi:saccharopine dehydrogenase [Gammaproteobacteria bacterium]|nr:saccharopine dehydrogenase [Gammaproteobacteria bacterium]